MKEIMPPNNGRRQGLRTLNAARQPRKRNRVLNLSTTPEEEPGHQFLTSLRSRSKAGAADLKNCPTHPGWANRAKIMLPHLRSKAGAADLKLCPTTPDE